jgi:hypothetical protein
MNLFLIGVGSSISEYLRVAELLQKKHAILYWVRMSGVVPLDESLFPHTIFHEYRDALKGIAPRSVDASAFEPWSAENISGFYETESELLSMMDKWYPSWPINQRKDFYYDLLRYWDGMLKRFAPDAIIFKAPPHEMYSFVLYSLAKKQSIKTIMLDCILRQDRLIIYKDYKRGNEVLAEKYGSIEQERKHATLEDLSDYAREYYIELSRSKNPTPHYVASWKLETEGIGKFRRHAKALIRFIKDGTVYERTVLRFFKMFKQGPVDEHRKCEKVLDFSKPYVYVPLHYQPECTTSPQGGVFVDQILMLKILSASLPKGWELYVKEHPAQLAHGNNYTPLRWSGFFESIAALPNVRLVPVDTNTFELTEKSKSVATISGTAGWEALVRGKPVLVFGYPWFMHAPGVLRASSVMECRDAFKHIEKGFVPIQSELLGYLTFVDKTGFRGYLNGYSKGIADFDVETAVRELHHALETSLSKS